MTLTVAPEANGEPSSAGLAKAKVASGKVRVSRLLANCGWALPFTLSAARSMRTVALVTRSPDMTTVPLTAAVRPTV